MAEFRTTFIPKTSSDAGPANTGGFGSGMPQRPTVNTARHGAFGLVTVGLVVLLFATLIISVGVYGINRTTSASIDELAATLERSRKAFEPKVILELKELDIRLKTASTLLAGHVALTSFFTMLGDQTLPGIAYDSLRFVNDPKQGYVVSITGRATSYETIAEQSSIFGDDGRIKQHVFSNFKLLDTGFISFDLFIIPTEKGILYAESEEVPVVIPVTTALPETNTATVNNPLFQTAPQTAGQNVIITNVQ